MYVFVSMYCLMNREHRSNCHFAREASVFRATFQAAYSCKGVNSKGCWSLWQRSMPLTGLPNDVSSQMRVRYPPSWILEAYLGVHTAGGEARAETPGQSVPEVEANFADLCLRMSGYF